MIVYDPSRRAPNWSIGTAERLDELLRPEDVVIEWGSGQSTVWLAQRVRLVVAVEHSFDWIDRVRDYLVEASLDNVVQVWAPRQDARYTAPMHLAAQLRSTASKRLVFVVDGWQRRQLADMVVKLSRPGDIAVFDDALDYLRADDAPPWPGWVWPGGKVERFAEPHPHAGVPIKRRPGRLTISLYVDHPDTKETWLCHRD